MEKGSAKKSSPKMGVALAVNHFSLNSRKKFVCLRVFDSTEEHTLEEWEKLFIKKEII